MSAIAKLSNTRIRLLPKEVDEIIDNFDDLNLRQKKAFASYVQSKDLTLGQQRALIAADPLWALKNVDLATVVQNAVLEKPKLRIPLYKAAADFEKISPKLLEAMLVSRKMTPQMMGAVLNNVPTQRMRARILDKFPTSVRYADGKVKLNKSIAESVLETSASLAKYISVIKSPAKEKLAALRAAKVAKAAKQISEPEDKAPAKKPAAKAKPAAEEKPVKTPAAKAKPAATKEEPAKKPAAKTPAVKTSTAKEKLAALREAKKRQTTKAEPAVKEKEVEEPKAKPAAKAPAKATPAAKPKPESKAPVKKTPAKKAAPVEEVEEEDEAPKAKPKRVGRGTVIDFDDADKTPEAKPKAAAKKAAPKAAKPEPTEEEDQDDGSDGSAKANRQHQALAEVLEDEIKGFNATTFMKHAEKALLGEATPLDKPLAKVVGDNLLVEAAGEKGITPLYLLMATLDDLDEVLTTAQNKLKTQAFEFLSTFAEGEEAEEEQAPTKPEAKAKPAPAAKPKAAPKAQKESTPDNAEEVYSVLKKLGGITDKAINQGLALAMEGKDSSLDSYVEESIGDDAIVAKANEAKVPMLYLLLVLTGENENIKWNKAQAAMVKKATDFIESFGSEEEEGEEPDTQPSQEPQPEPEIEVKQKPKREPKPKAKAQPKTEEDEEADEEAEQKEYQRRSRGRTIDLDELDVDDDVSDWRNDNMFSNGTDVKDVVTLEPADERKFVNLIKSALRKLVKTDDFKAAYQSEITREELSEQILSKLEQLVDSASDAQDFKKLSGVIQDSVFNLAIPVEKIVLRSASSVQDKVLGEISTVVKKYGFPVTLEQIEARKAEIIGLGSKYDVTIESVDLSYARSAGITKAEEMRVRVKAAEDQQFIAMFDLTTGNYTVL